MRKVICKGDKDRWKKQGKNVEVTKRFFGLIKSTKITDGIPVPGPRKDEVCIVTGSYIDDVLYYYLQEYPYGGYDSRYFIDMSEFEETEKEIAEKAEIVLN